MTEFTYLSSLSIFHLLTFLEVINGSSGSQMFFKIGVLNNLRNFMGKHVLESLSNIVADLMVCCEISQIFKNTFFTKHLRWLLLEGVFEGTSLVKSCNPVILIYLESITDASERCPIRKIMNNRYCWNDYRFSCLKIDNIKIWLSKQL